MGQELSISTISEAISFESLLNKLPSEENREKLHHAKTERITAVGLLEQLGVTRHYREAILAGDLALAQWVSDFGRDPETSQKLPHHEIHNIVGLVVVAESPEDRYLHEVSEAAGEMIADWDRNQGRVTAYYTSELVA